MKFGSFFGVVANVLDCDIVVSVFKYQSTCRYVSDFPQCQNATQCHFIAATAYESRHARQRQHILGSVGIPLLGCLRRRAINSTMQSIQSLEERPLRRSAPRAIVTTCNEYQLPSRMGLQNKQTAYLRKGKTPQMSVLDMTQNNLSARFQ